VNIDPDADVDHAEMIGTGPLRDLTPRQFDAARWDPFIEYVVFEGLIDGDSDHPHEPVTGNASGTEDEQ
jgi:hypothetical protein